MSLIVEKGRLEDILPRFKRNFIQTSAQLTKARVEDEKLGGTEGYEGLRDIWFWTGDALSYRTEDRETVLYVGPASTNSVFNNIAEAARQLRQDYNYKLTDADLEKVLDSYESGKTTRVVLDELELINYNNEFSFFTIDIDNLDSLSNAQRAVTELFFGQGEDFETHIGLLRESGTRRKRVYVLNPDYVKKHAGETGLARVGVLFIFNDYSFFSAGNRLIGGSKSLCEVRAGGTVPEIDPTLQELFQLELEFYNTTVKLYERL